MEKGKLNILAERILKGNGAVDFVDWNNTEEIEFVLNKLQGEGLIVIRIRDEQDRAITYCLTDKGRQLVHYGGGYAQFKKATEIKLYVRKILDIIRFFIRVWIAVFLYNLIFG